MHWQNISLTSEWLDEVYAGIQSADTFLFPINPSVGVSMVCTLEIEYAVQYNKQLVSVAWRDVEAGQVFSHVCHN